MTTAEERVYKLVADRLGVDRNEITLESSFIEDLNADSLDLVELIMAFEAEFSTNDNALEISNGDAENITTVGSMVKFLLENES